MLILLAAWTIIVTGMSERADSEGSRLISRAMRSVREAIPIAEEDLTRPAFHFHAPAHWMNDPNGPIYYRGWFHVFYQFNPYGDQWGNMHWGHARSRDLVNWEHLPIALWPSKSQGEDHAYSGSSYLNGKGRPTVFYTSIGARAPEQWSAFSNDDDLVGWSKSPVNPVVSVRTQSPVNIEEWRDPFLFTEANTTYMITGGRNHGHGVVAAYQAADSDLKRWHYLGILFQHPDAGDVECPNIVKLGDRWVLLTSHGGKVDWFSGSLDLAALHFVSRRRGILAEGSYASQLLTDKRGQCVHLAWMPTSAHRGWNGFLTLPSIVSLDRAGHLVRKPIPKLSKLRDRRINLSDVDLDGEIDLSNRISGNQLEVIADIDLGRASKIDIRLVTSANGERSVTLTYDVRENRLLTPGREAVILASAGNLKLHLFLDRSALDVYADGGKLTQCASFQPTAGDQGVRIASEGGRAKIRSLRVYTLKGAQFDMTRFK